MNLLSLFGLEKRSENTEPVFIAPGITIPQRSVSGINGIPAVFRALTVLQSAVGQLSLDAWRNGEQLTGALYPDVLRSPFDQQTQKDLITDLMASLVLRGNAYALAIRNRENRLTGVRVLNPSDCLPVLDEKTGLRYTQYDGKKYRSRDLAHMPFLRTPGNAEGMSPIGFAREVFNRAHRLANAADHVYETGGVPTGILTSEQDINPEQARVAKDQWNQRNSAKNGVAVLGKGLKYTPISITPADAQFLESQKYSDQQIATLFGIPPHLMGITLDGGAMTYQNLQDADMSFMRWTVTPYLNAIENGLSKLMPARTEVRFNLDAVLRPDTKKRMETHEIAIRAGIYTPEYAAAEIEGLPPFAYEN